MNTLYGEVSNDVINKAADIQLLICDVDGVFSDGRIYLGNDGEELKAFHTKDGYGIKALIASGIDVAIITGRRSKIVSNRMKSLNVKHIIQGEEQKFSTLVSLIEQLNINIKNVAYIGDDMPDSECILSVGLGIAVNDSHPQILTQAKYVTFTKGGFGAVREVCDLIMQSQNSLVDASGSST